MRCLRDLHVPRLRLPCPRPQSRHLHNHLNPLLTPRIQVVSHPPDIAPPIDHHHHLWNVNPSSQPPPDATNPLPASLFDTDIPDAAPPPNSFDASYKREKLLLERNLEFTAAEIKIMKTLRRAQYWINQQRHEQGKTSRITAYLGGAWIRDKILGKQNNHVNVVLENCDPYEFAQVMIEYNGLRYRGVPLKELKPRPPRPDKTASSWWVPRVWALKGEYAFGKNETIPFATIIFFVAKYKVTIVPLRVLTTGEPDPKHQQKDEKDAKNPRTTSSSELNYHSIEGKVFPKEINRRQNLWLSQDALSRDLTINAMYLTIQSSKQLLDPTKRGFQDIQSRILRTTRSVLATLLDEPIRILRIITLAGRFQYLNFRLDKQFIETIKYNRDIRVTPRLPDSRVQPTICCTYVWAQIDCRRSFRVSIGHSL